MRETKVIITDIPYFRDGKITAIPKEAYKGWNVLGLTPTERALYLAFICSYGTEAVVSYDELSALVGICIVTAVTIIKRFKELGLIEVISGTGQGGKNQYKIKYIYTTEELTEITPARA